MRFRPIRFLYHVGLGGLAYSWFGWWGVLIAFLPTIDVEYRRG